VLGVWLIVTGVSELLSVQVSARKTILSGSGIFSILIGVLLVIAPFAGLAAVSWLIALLLLVSGAGMLALAIGLPSSGFFAEKDRNE